MVGDAWLFATCESESEGSTRFRFRPRLLLYRQPLFEQVRTCSDHSVLPHAHPFTIAPSERSEQCDVTTFQIRLHRVVERQEFGVIKLLLAHGWAAKGEPIVGLEHTPITLRNGNHIGLSSRISSPLSYEIRHSLRIAGATVIYNCYMHESLLRSISVLAIANNYNVRSPLSPVKSVIGPVQKSIAMWTAFD